MYSIVCVSLIGDVGRERDRTYIIVKVGGLNTPMIVVGVVVLLTLFFVLKNAGKNMRRPDLVV